MTRSQIEKLSYQEQIALSNKKRKSGSYTAEALTAQIILWEESWKSIQQNNEPNPFDYEPFSMED